MSALDRDAAATSPALDDVKWSPLKVVAKMRDLRLHIVFQSERGEFEWGIHGAGGWPLGLGTSSSLEDAKAAVVYRARELLTTTGPRWPKPSIPHEVPCKWLGRAMHIDCWLREDDGRILATARGHEGEHSVEGPFKPKKEKTT